MSDNADEPAGSKNIAAPAPDYEVGYGKPPVKHRFKKGQSGNIYGRRPNPRARRLKFDPAGNPTDSLILEEAYRMVTIREGDKAITHPLFARYVDRQADRALQFRRHGIGPRAVQVEHGHAPALAREAACHRRRQSGTTAGGQQYLARKSHCHVCVLTSYTLRLLKL